MKIAVLTGGGDCPGMNAFVRAITRAHLNLGGPEAEVVGVLDGWAGMISGSYRRLSILDTAGIGRLGGTILGTLRAPALKQDEAVQQQVAERFPELAGRVSLLDPSGDEIARSISPLNSCEDKL